MLEQYDFVIYGTASALIFGRLFFPNISPAAGTMASFGAYTVGFAARPLGGLFFSRYGDLLGRKWVLVATLLFMGGSTLAIGLLPTFDQVGLLAPSLLVLCRFFQGFGAGAEQAWGATLLTETAPPGQRGRYASLIMVGAALGNGARRRDLGSGAAAPGRSSARLGLATDLPEQHRRDDFRDGDAPDAEGEPSLPGGSSAGTRIAEAGRRGRQTWTPAAVLVFFMNAGVNAQSYTYQVLMACVPDVGNPRRSQVRSARAARRGSLRLRLVVPDRSSFRRLWKAPHRSARHGGSGAAAGARVHRVEQRIDGGHRHRDHFRIHAGRLRRRRRADELFPELFGSRYRYAGVTLGREFSSVVGGGVAPLICAALLTWFNKSWVPVAIYMTAMSLISFVAARFAPETSNRDLTVERDA